MVFIDEVAYINEARYAINSLAKIGEFTLLQVSQRVSSVPFQYVIDAIEELVANNYLKTINIGKYTKVSDI